MLGSTVLVLSLITGLAVVYAWRHLEGNLETISDDGILTDRPDKVEVEGPKEPLNILVMGSDSREGENNIDGLTGGGERSDTTILMHVSADRETAYGVSLPRDAIVDRPECKVRGSDPVPAEDGVMFNTAFSEGGPLCTVQMMETLTDIRIDHYVVVDFNGFKDMVDAVDGVEVCIPKTVDDPEHDIYLEAGTREISGREALNYVRERTQLSANSDIGRMKRQQAFIASMINKVVSADTLSRPDRLFKFLDAATKSIMLDEDLASLTKLADLGMQFKNTGLDKIKFITVPWEFYEPDPNRLVWTEDAELLWDKIRKDQPLGNKLSDGVISAAKPPGQDGPSGSPDDEATDGPTGDPDGDTSADDLAEAEALENGLCA
ncbi:LCP family protein [Nocardioides pacificus]